MDRYSVALPNGRSLSLSAHQIELVALGLGHHGGAGPDDSAPPIVEAMRALPPTERADAFAVVLLRFGHKQDIESIAHYSGLSPWDVWRLEEAFCQALAGLRATDSRVPPVLVS